MKRNLSAICGVAALALMTACSAASNNIVDLDKSTKGYRITCDGGMGSDKADCYKQAAYICQNKGYTVISEKNITPDGWMGDDYEILTKCNNQA